MSSNSSRFPSNRAHKSEPGRSGWLKYVLAGIGIPIAVVIYLQSSGPSKKDVYQHKVEKAFGLSPSMMAAETRICETAEKRRKISETDWKVNLQAYHEGNKFAKEMCLQTLAFLRENNPHKAESIALAKDYIQQNGIADWHPAITLLNRLNDPSWSTYNNQGLSSQDPVVKQSYEFYTSSVLKLGQKPEGQKGS